MSNPFRKDNPLLGVIFMGCLPIVLMVGYYVALLFSNDLYDRLGLAPVYVALAIMAITGALMTWSTGRKHRGSLSAVAKSQRWRDTTDFSLAEDELAMLRDRVIGPDIGGATWELRRLEGAEGSSAAGNPFAVALVAIVNINTVRTYYSVVSARVPQTPEVEFVPDGFTGRLAAIAGATDLDVESAAFNARWRVRAKDHRRTHALLTPTVIGALLEPALAGHRILVGKGLVLVVEYGDVDFRKWVALADATGDLAAEIPNFTVD